MNWNYELKPYNENVQVKTAYDPSSPIYTNIILTTVPNGQIYEYSRSSPDTLVTGQLYFTAAALVKLHIPVSCHLQLRTLPEGVHLRELRL